MDRVVEWLQGIPVRDGLSSQSTHAAGLLTYLAAGHPGPATGHDLKVNPF
jgi:hypothetical protein